MKRIWITPALALSFASAFAAQDPAATQAQEAARAWLALTDRGDYAKSWDEAAALFRNAITRPAWQAALTSVRTPLGALKARRLRSATPTHSLPGAPDGNYVVIQFDTSFEHKASAIETVTPMQEADGTWRVSGYYIR